MEIGRNPVGIFRVPSPLEDRIRELCAKAITSGDPSVLSELRSAMREHIQRIRTLAVRQVDREGPRGDET